MMIWLEKQHNNRYLVLEGNWGFLITQYEKDLLKSERVERVELSFFGWKPNVISRYTIPADIFIPQNLLTLLDKVHQIYSLDVLAILVMRKFRLPKILLV